MNRLSVVLTADGKAESTWRWLEVMHSKELYNWSVHYLSLSKLKYSQKYPFARIADFLERSKDVVIVNDDKRYKRVTVKLYGGGVTIRDEVLGKDIGTKRQFLLKKGQFLFSRIDARNGAFGIATDEVDNAIVTNDFPIFDIDKEQIIPEFFALITGSQYFYEHCQTFSSGTTNRQRLNEDSFLSFQIPKPSLSIQKQLVSAYQNRLQQVEEAEAKANELEKGIENYLLAELGIEMQKADEQKKKGLQFMRFKDITRWGVEFLIKGQDKPLFSKKFALVNLSEIIWVNPKISFSELTSETEITFIPMATVSDEYGELIEYRTIKVANSKGYTKIKEGDLIWAKITPCMENGKSAIVKNLKNRFACGSTEFHVFRPKDERINLEFLYHLFRTEYLKETAKKHFTGSVGQQRVPAQFFKTLEIPLPPLSIQTTIVSHIAEQKAEIKRLKAEAEKLRKEAKEEFEREVFEN